MSFAWSQNFKMFLVTCDVDKTEIVRREQFNNDETDGFMRVAYPKKDSQLCMPIKPNPWV